MVRWKDAAVQNPVLTAAELYFMARPDERVPWRKLLSLPPHPPSHGVSAPAPERWGARKRRTSKAAATTMTTAKATAADVKEAEEKSPGRASPTTPLSWNACEFGRGARDSASGKKRSVAAGSAANGGRGGRGSAKVAAELQEQEWSLLEKNTLLKKEVEEHKLARSMLMEENKRLKSLKSKLHHWAAAEATGAANARSEETDREEHRFLPFDLNQPFPAPDLEDATTD